MKSFLYHYYDGDTFLHLNPPIILTFHMIISMVR